MANNDAKFALPSEIDSYLAVLATLYTRRGDATSLAIVVNAEVQIDEGVEHFSFDSGVSGHGLYLTVPDEIYLDVVDDIGTVQDTIRSDLNTVHNLRNETIAFVRLEPRRRTNADWRRESGALRNARTVAKSEAERIWGRSCFRLFLSHTWHVKQAAGELKSALAKFGVSAFVAHDDIKPTLPWQNEIEAALGSMDGFVALLTNEYHESFWTDQEVGFALARGIRLIAVKLGRDPYGFIGKFQALKCDPGDVPLEIVKLLINEPAMLKAYIAALPQCNSFAEGNQLAQVLLQIQHIDAEDGDALTEAFNRSVQLQGSYGFNGESPAQHGGGLAKILSLKTNQNYVMENRTIKKRSAR